MYKTFKFDLGRDALKHVVQEYEIKEMHIPYYLCDVIRHTLVETKCKPIFYHIDDNFYPLEEFLENDYILYPNYWGVCGENVKKLAKKYSRLIVDNAHAFFEPPMGFACFNAGHKFGIKESYLMIKDDTSDKVSDGFANSEKYIEPRKKEFLKLHNIYKDINLLNIDLSSVPFCYPCLTETTKQADELVKKLKKEGKIIYRYWNPLPKSFNEYKFYSRLVPIPILPTLS